MTVVLLVSSLKILRDLPLERSNFLRHPIANLDHVTIHLVSSIVSRTSKQSTSLSLDSLSTAPQVRVAPQAIGSAIFPGRKGPSTSSIPARPGISFSRRQLPSPMHPSSSEQRGNQMRSREAEEGSRWLKKPVQRNRCRCWLPVCGGGAGGAA